MIKNFNRFGLGAALVLSMVFGACSKKNTVDDGDMAATGLSATDLSAGSTVPELPPVYFAYDAFTLDGASRSSLQGHAAWLRNNPAVNIQVEGHCDERGTTEYNLALGERRAAAVRDYLISQGIESGRVSTLSYGEERPAVSGASNEATWSRNRRAEFVLAN